MSWHMVPGSCVCTDTHILSRSWTKLLGSVMVCETDASQLFVPHMCAPCEPLRGCSSRYNTR